MADGRWQMANGDGDESGKNEARTVQLHRKSEESNKEEDEEMSRVRYFLFIYLLI